MKRRIQQFFIFSASLICALFLVNCGGYYVSANRELVQILPDTSVSMRFSTKIDGKTYYDYGERTLRMGAISLSLDSSTDLNYSILRPRTNSSAPEHVVVFVPGFESPSEFQTVVAARVAELGKNALIFNYRGDGRNETLRKTWGTKESADLIYALIAYQVSVANDKSLAVSFVGSSLGCSLILKALKDKDEYMASGKKLHAEVRSIAFISSVKDLRQGMEALASDEQQASILHAMAQEKLKFEDISIERLLPSAPRHPKFMALWAKNDKVVQMADREFLSEIYRSHFLNAQIDFFEEVTHAVIIGVPAKQDAVEQIHERIVRFAVEALQE